MHETIERLQDTLDLCPELHFDTVVLHDDGTMVTVNWNGRSTQRDGRSFEYCGIEVFRVVDGKIVEIWNSREAAGPAAASDVRSVNHVEPLAALLTYVLGPRVDGFRAAGESACRWWVVERHGDRHDRRWAAGRGPTVAGTGSEVPDVRPAARARLPAIARRRRAGAARAWRGPGGRHRGPAGVRHGLGRDGSLGRPTDLHRSRVVARRRPDPAAPVRSGAPRRHRGDQRQRPCTRRGRAAAPDGVERMRRAVDDLEAIWSSIPVTVGTALAEVFDAVRVGVPTDPSRDGMLGVTPVRRTSSAASMVSSRWRWSTSSWQRGDPRSST